MNITVFGERYHDLELAPEQRGEGGCGWVRRLRHLFAIHGAHAKDVVDVVDATEPGNTAHNLRERWTDDVLLPKPDVVLVTVGMSDAWGHQSKSNQYAKDPAGVIAILEDLFARAKTRTPQTRILLVEPVLNSIDASPLRTGPVAEALTAYAVALRDLAGKHGLTIIPAGELVRAAKRARNDDEWLGTDPTGLDICGSMLVADAAYRAIAGKPAAPATVLENGQTLLLIGDSITDAGRRGTYSAMGVGYARVFQGIQAAREPQKVVKMINKGIGGDTILDIESRWERDVTPHNPDWLLLYTGINDMNTIYGSRAKKVLPDVYRDGLRRCLARVKTTSPAVRCMLLAPYLLTRDDHPESYRCEMVRRMPDYARAAESVAKEFGARFVDLQSALAPFVDRLGNRALGCNLGTDICHPGELGCLAIAELVYGAFKK